MDGKEVLELLLDGNRRFMSGQLSVKSATDLKKRRTELAIGQKPMATIVTCSDSRVVPEYIFDIGLGDIFTVISAGNVLDSVGVGSVEYAVGHLHTPLLIVLGHEFCGAVVAAYDDVNESHITDIVKLIAPSVNKIRGIKNGDRKSELEAVCNENVREMIEKLKTSPIIKEALGQHRHLKIVGMKYHLSDGKAEILFE